MQRVDGRYWREGKFSETHEDAETIACLLMARLSDLQRRSAVQVLVMLQKSKLDEAPDPRGERVLECAKARGLSTLNLFPLLGKLSAEDPELAAKLFFGHMTPVGNEWVARLLADETRARGWLDGS